ncbi:hypothetical protein [Martelella sp. HB161492]|uniref:hypothetical protein n=1 Tax=Martelella sp. HB161492 TaxID=2720726 RepID=UPI0015913556|nr:hypothetical protein [Martelella sp. HB161492]
MKTRIAIMALAVFVAAPAFAGETEVENSKLPTFTADKIEEIDDSSVALKGDVKIFLGDHTLQTDEAILTFDDERSVTIDAGKITIIAEDDGAEAQGADNAK